MKSSFYVRSFRLAVLLCACSCLATESFGADPYHSPADSQPPDSTVAIPGPLRSFLRMAGISQKAAGEEVIPLLARNVFLLGYEGPSSHVRPTEFLILLSRYVQQARELDVMAGAEGIIRVSNCEQAKPLLQVLGSDAMPLEIRDFLKKEFGVDMDAQTISNYKSTLKNKSRRGPKRRTGPAPVKAPSGFTLQDIQAVKEMADRIGADKVRQLAEVLSK